MGLLIMPTAFRSDLLYFFPFKTDLDLAEVPFLKFDPGFHFNFIMHNPKCI